MDMIVSGFEKSLSNIRKSYCDIDDDEMNLTVTEAEWKNENQ